MLDNIDSTSQNSIDNLLQILHNYIIVDFLNSMFSLFTLPLILPPMYSLMSSPMVEVK